VSSIFTEEESIVVKAIVGANWGDEGKGKITDLFSEASDVVIRFQGGANAGHTIICDYGKFALHQLPSGVFYPHTTNIIGNGVALNIPALIAELDTLKKGGVPAPKLIISERAQILMPYHILQDTYEEQRLEGKAFGSTKSGIAPFYSDKYAKYGIQVSDLFDEAHLFDRLRAVCEIKNVLMEHLYKKPLLDPEALMQQLLDYRDQIAPYVGDAFAFIQDAIAQGKEILLEGQLGAMKDPDFGIYPFTTSSHTLAGFGTVGAGIAPKEITQVVAVTKAYSSAVGAGAFVSELFGEEADTLRRLGGDAGEYGATTGRPRRVGWFDAVATKYGCQVQGATQAVLTAIDVLGYLDEIKVCTGYEIDGVVTDVFPVPSRLERAKPVYETLPGWKSDVRGVTDYNALPQQARDYVEFIENKIGVPITMVSTGPKRHEITTRIP
jgi:adenylosuccinate synthase